LLQKYAKAGIAGSDRVRAYGAVGAQRPTFEGCVAAVVAAGHAIGLGPVVHARVGTGVRDVPSTVAFLRDGIGARVADIIAPIPRSQFLNALSRLFGEVAGEPEPGELTKFRVLQSVQSPFSFHTVVIRHTVASFLAR
jgi:hypothetical protein